MTKSDSPSAPESTCSEQTDESARSDAILALGRNLVDELGLEPSVDTLARWMAHYVAELIVRTENACGEEKIVLQKNCFDAILALWDHRAALPSGRRPFERLEPIARSIESLDPDDNDRRYFRSAHPPRAGEESDEIKEWTGIADSIDHSARVLIGYCLSQAARAAMDKSKEWVELAEAAGGQQMAEQLVLRYVATFDDLVELDVHAEVRRSLEDRLKRLEEFSAVAEAFENALRKRIEELPSEFETKP